jgi:pimeloyl-ACP methyl ester carboxylesterase
VGDHLHVEVDGDPGRPALLLVHGFMSSNLQWALNRGGLMQHFRLAAAELWGHGKSPSPEDPACYGVDRYVAEFERIRERLGADRWYVCGQSFGAGLAIRYALAYPDRIAGLVVTNSRSALNDVAREADAAGRLEAWEEVDPRSLPYHPRHARRFPPDLKARMEAAADAIPRRALGQAAGTTARGLSCRHVAADVAVPTLLVNGRFEKSFQADRDFAAATVPDIEVVDLDAGHSVNIEAPQAFDRALIGFAARHA